MITEKSGKNTLIKGLALILTLIAISFLLVYLSNLLDKNVGKDGSFLFVNNKNFQHLADFLSNSSEVVPSIIGIVITVIAILLEISASKYSSRIIDFFIRDKLILFSLGFLIFSAIYNIFININISSGLGKASVLFSLFIMAAIIAILFPLFNYIIKFFKAENILTVFQKKHYKRNDAL